MGAEDRPNTVAKTGAFGLTCPEGFRNGDRLENPRQAERGHRSSEKVTYMISILRGVVEKVIQENRGERWQIIELKEWLACKGATIYWGGGGAHS